MDLQGYISLHTSCSRLLWPPPSLDSYITDVIITCIAFMIEELKKHPLASTDMAVVLVEGFEHLKLAHYCNQLLHLFLPEAFLLFCLLRLPELISTLSRYVIICIFFLSWNKRMFVKARVCSTSPEEVCQIRCIT